MLAGPANAGWLPLELLRVAGELGAAAAALPCGRGGAGAFWALRNHLSSKYQPTNPTPTHPIPPHTTPPPLHPRPLLQEPFRTLARQGLGELLAGAGGERVLPVIPQLIMPLRAALSSRDADVVQAGLHALGLLLGGSEGAGRALLPYRRQLLPPLARHASGDDRPHAAPDCSPTPRRGGSSLAAHVLATLHQLERSAGADTFLHIKYHVPTYQSCLQPSRVARKA